MKKPCRCRCGDFCPICAKKRNFVLFVIKETLFFFLVPPICIAFHIAVWIFLVVENTAISALGNVGLPVFPVPYFRCNRGLFALLFSSSSLWIATISKSYRRFGGRGRQMSNCCGNTLSFCTFLYFPLLSLTFRPHSLYN